MTLTEQVYQLMSGDDYAGALSLLIGAAGEVLRDEQLLIAKGHCQYELRMELEALRSYLLYLSKFPNGGRVESAMFNSSLCLKNLGLQEEAQHLLQKISPGYECLEEELKHSADIVEQRDIAMDLLRKTGLSGQ